MLLYEEFKVILVREDLLHILFYLGGFLLVLLVAVLVGGHVLIHLVHLGPVLADGRLRLVHGVLLVRDLSAGFCQLRVEVSKGLVFLIELFIEVLLILLVLICKVLNLQLQFLDSL